LVEAWAVAWFHLLAALVAAWWELRPLTVAVRVVDESGAPVAGAVVEAPASGQRFLPTAAQPAAQPTAAPSGESPLQPSAQPSGQPSAQALASVRYSRSLLPLTLRGEAPGFAPGETTLASPGLAASLPEQVTIVLAPLPRAPTPEAAPRPPAPPGFAFAAALPAPTPETLPPETGEETHWVVDHLVFAAAALLFLAGVWTWNRLRRRGWLERLPATGSAAEKRLDADDGRWRGAFRGERLRLLRALRRRRWLPSSELDGERSVAATLAAGGLFTPVFGSLVEPEFLVLVDRASLRDHLALTVDELLAGLQSRGLSVERFHYARDPSRCRHQPFKRGAGDLGGQDLEQLAARFAARRLLVFADARELIDSYSGRPAASVARLLAWPQAQPLLLTPRPRRAWGRSEWLLERAGLRLLPLDAAGLRLLGEIVGQQRVVAPPAVRRAERPRPPYLRDLDRLLGGEDPGADFTARVVDALAGDLPPRVFVWLAACAVYPEIHWPLTLRLGDGLIADERERADALPQLAQLPWLRHAYLPDWLRRALLARLAAGQRTAAPTGRAAAAEPAADPAADLAAIRQTLADFLDQLHEAPATPGALRIAAPARRWSSFADVRRGLRALFAGQAAGERPPAVEDRVFLRFMSAPSNPLGVRASETLRRIFYRDALPLAGLRVVPLFVVGALAVGLLQHFFPLRAQRTLVGPTPPAIVRTPSALALDSDGRGLLVGDSHRGLQAWQESESGWQKVAAETSRTAGPLAAVALAPGRLLGAGASGLQIRPAAVGGPAETGLDGRVQADPVVAAERYGDAPDGEFQLQGAAAAGGVMSGARPGAPAGAPLCIAIDAAGGRAFALGAEFLAARIGGGETAVDCAVAHGGTQLAVLGKQVHVLPLRARAAAGGGRAAPAVTLPAGDWRRVALSADGRTIAATGSDGRVVVIRPSAGEPTILDGLRAAGPLALSGDGLTLAFADSERQVQVWRIERPGRAVLLTVAVDTVDAAGNPLRLQTPVADVRRVADVLVRRYAFEVVRLDNPRRDAVVQTLDDLQQRLAAQDQLLVYFSGAAVFDAGGKSGKDGKGRFSFVFAPAKRDAAPDTWTLSGADLAARLARLPARQILAVVDTSNAAALTLAAKAATAGGARGLLFSAGVDQMSADTTDFSTALANALASAPAPLTGRALATDLARRLPAEARRTQTPGYADWPAAGHAGGEIVLTPRGARLPEQRFARRAPAEPTPVAPATATPPAMGGSAAGASTDPSAAQSTATVPVIARGSRAPTTPGAIFRDCADCPEMVVVPPGEFLMGSPENEPGRWPSEGPLHRVRITRAFAVGRYEVTFAEWDACVVAGGCQHKPDDRGWGRGRQPVMAVDWDDARKYAAWLAKTTGARYRLLSEAEWEYAARAGEQKAYPWGDQFGDNRANLYGSGSRWSGKQTAPIASFAPNAFGLHDMIGNVWERVEDCWHDDYKGAPTDGSVWQGGDCGRRVVRGGSWDGKPGTARAAYRSSDYSDDRVALSGFRLARTLP
ncbi:SUMF1/EgtB/PvdO family nonheme iron enzyme, partial [Accumulibacter sp.]|uniref:SUMF1/EgtB/PvdO family nonheme iron enzyme n=1 Tax=Accumulibacter sp. TaxID=2053492 RepID=UPI0028795107